MKICLFSLNYIFMSIIVLMYFVARNQGKSIKIQIECDDILKILAGLTNQDYKTPEVPIEITKVIAQVDKNGKVIGNPYHPEDSTADYSLSQSNTNNSKFSNKWEAKQEIEMDLMKLELEKKLDRENHNFIAKPAVISEDELEGVEIFNQTMKMYNTDAVTENYLQKLMQKGNDGNSQLQVDRKDDIIREKKKEANAEALENNAVHVEKNLDETIFNINKKRFQLKKVAEGDGNDQTRIDHSPTKTEMELVWSGDERAKRPADNQDFKDFQRRFILVDGPEKKKISY